MPTTDTQLRSRAITSFNPATGEALVDLECATAEAVYDAVADAHLAQRRWRELTAGKRVALLRRFGRILHERKSEIAELITREAGKPVVEALLTEVVVALDAVRFLANTAGEFLQDERVAHANPIMKLKRGSLVREPHGVIGIISPWNYPFSIPATETLAALVTGNAVVLKPSEFTPLCALKLQELLLEAGFPEKLFQVVIGEGATGAALIEAPVNKILFTGSVATGKRVAEACARRLLPCVLELGGKDPMIVLEDADLDAVSTAAVWGAFMNAGQTCLSVERCYVHRDLHDRFLDLCTSKTAKLRVGDGMLPETDVGPMIHERQLQIVEAQVAEALHSGARLVTGGRRLPELGRNFYAPTMLADVDHSMRILREETFGPVLPVIPFDSDEEAVQFANDSEFGLAASIWTRDLTRGEALARRIEAGTVMVNDVIACFGICEAPHGGVKHSGIGRTNGRLGLDEMIRTKYVDVDRLPRMKKAWWYGYGGEFRRQMEGFADFLFAESMAARLRGGVRAIGSLWRKNEL